MSDVKRLPDADGWWWNRGWTYPFRVRLRGGTAQRLFAETGEWCNIIPGEYLPCPAPEWPPEPPPRPKLVWASCVGDERPPAWWMHVVGFGWVAHQKLHGRTAASTSELTPHDHPEQSAEESRRILAENNS